VEKNSKTDRLILHIPSRDDLRFRQKLLSDPDTMAYNAAWFPPDGCIDFPESAWDSWYDMWIGHGPDCFYAYLRRISDGVFVGEVNYHRSPECNSWDMGIVVSAAYRGLGYGFEGLRLLVEHAFLIDGVSCLQNEFETTRDTAYRIHKAAGFREICRKDGIVRLEMIREDYLSQ
jgi:RimJ/RimL family protein N-acetyltransferase